MWIEIYACERINNGSESLPSRECGLKYAVTSISSPVRSVTPFAGVWIEIYRKSVSIPQTAVTPFAGVWIEIEGVI